MQKLTGIVIRETKINEADKMLTVLTEELGPISVLAKNIRKNKSRISAAAGFLCYSDFVLSGGPEIYYINQCSLIENFFNISEDIQKLALASYMGYITTQLFPVGEPQTDAVRLYLNTLYVLANTDKDIFMIKSVFEFRLMMHSGYMPDVFKCAVCGEEHFPMYFDIDNANVKCFNCGKSYYELTEPMIYAIRYILTCDIKKVFSFELKKEMYFKLSETSKTYLISILGHIPKTLEYFESLF